MTSASKLRALLTNAVVAVCKSYVPFKEALLIKATVFIEVDGDNEYKVYFEKKTAQKQGFGNTLLDRRERVKVDSSDKVSDGQKDSCRKRKNGHYDVAICWAKKIKTKHVRGFAQKIKALSRTGRKERDKGRGQTSSDSPGLVAMGNGDEPCCGGEHSTDEASRHISGHEGQIEAESEPVAMVKADNIRLPESADKSRTDGRSAASDVHDDVVHPSVNGQFIRAKVWTSGSASSVGENDQRVCDHAGPATGATSNMVRTDTICTQLVLQGDSETGRSCAKSRGNTSQNETKFLSRDLNENSMASCREIGDKETKVIDPRSSKNKTSENENFRYKGRTQKVTSDNLSKQIAKNKSNGPNLKTACSKQSKDPKGSPKLAKEAIKEGKTRCRRTFVCDICAKSFTLRTNLTRHLRHMHNASQKENSAVLSNQSAPLSICPADNKNALSGSNSGQGVIGNGCADKMSSADNSLSCDKVRKERDKPKGGDVCGDKKEGDDVILTDIQPPRRNQMTQRRILPAPTAVKTSNIGQHMYGTAYIAPTQALANQGPAFVYLVSTSLASPHSTVSMVKTTASVTSQAMTSPHETVTSQVATATCSSRVLTQKCSPFSSQAVAADVTSGRPHVTGGDKPFWISPSIQNSKQSISESGKDVSDFRDMSEVNCHAVQRYSNEPRGANSYCVNSSSTSFAGPLSRTSPTFVQPNAVNPNRVNNKHMRSKSAEIANESINSNPSSANTSIDVVNVSGETTAYGSCRDLRQTSRAWSAQDLSGAKSQHYVNHVKSHSLSQLNVYTRRSMGELIGSDFASYGKSHSSSKLAAPGVGWARDVTLRRRPLSAEALNLAREPPPLKEQPKVLGTPGKGVGDNTRCDSDDEGEPLSPLVPHELHEESCDPDRSMTNLSNGSGVHLKEALERVSEKLQAGVDTCTSLQMCTSGGKHSSCPTPMEEQLSPIVSPPNVEEDHCASGSSSASTGMTSHIKEALENVSKELEEKMRSVTEKKKFDHCEEKENTGVPEMTGKKISDNFPANSKNEATLESRTISSDDCGRKQGNVNPKINAQTTAAPVYNGLSQDDESKYVKDRGQAFSPARGTRTAVLFSQGQECFPTLGFYDMISPQKPANSAETSASFSPLYNTSTSTPLSPYLNRSNKSVDRQDKDSSQSPLRESNLATPIFGVPNSFTPIMLSDTLSQVNKFSDIALSPYKPFGPLSPYKMHQDASQLRDYAYLSPSRKSPMASSHTLLTPPRFYGNGYFPVMTSPRPPERPKSSSPHIPDVKNSASFKNGRDSREKMHAHGSHPDVTKNTRSAPETNATEGQKPKNADVVVKRRRLSSRAHRFDCTLCDAKFTFRTNLTRHMKKVHDTNPLQSCGAEHKSDN